MQGWSDGPGSTWDPCDPPEPGQACALDEEEEVVSPIKSLPARRSTFTGLQRRHAASAAAAAAHPPSRSRFFVQHQLHGDGADVAPGLGARSPARGPAAGGAGCLDGMAAGRMHPPSQLHAGYVRAFDDSQDDCLPPTTDSPGLDSNGLPKFDCEEEGHEPSTAQHTYRGNSHDALGHQPRRQLLGRRALDAAASGVPMGAEADARLDAMPGSLELPTRQLLGRRALDVRAPGLLADDAEAAWAAGPEAGSEQPTRGQLLGRRALEGCVAGPMSAAEGAAAALDAEVGISDPQAAAAAGAGAHVGGAGLAVPLVRPPHAAPLLANSMREWPADPCGIRAGSAAVGGGDGAAAAPASNDSEGSSEPEGPGADENAFHSISHVKRYAKLAAAVVDKVARHAGVGLHPLQQRVQQQQVQQRGPIGLQPSEQRQQQQQQQQQGRAGLVSNAARAQFKPPVLQARAGLGQSQEQAAPAKPVGSFERFAFGRKAS